MNEHSEQSSESHLGEPGGTPSSAVPTGPSERGTAYITTMYELALTSRRDDDGAQDAHLRRLAELTDPFSAMSAEELRHVLNGVHDELQVVLSNVLASVDQDPGPQASAQTRGPTSSSARNPGGAPGVGVYDATHLGLEQGGSPANASDSRPRVMPIPPPVIEGPVPNFRRGRAYAVHVHDAVIALLEDQTAQANDHMHDADRLLWPLGDDTAEDLRGFVAGLANAVDNLVDYYDEHLVPNVSDAPGAASGSTGN